MSSKSRFLLCYPPEGARDATSVFDERLLPYHSASGLTSLTTRHIIIESTFRLDFSAIGDFRFRL